MAEVGTWLTGASLTALTLIAITSVALCAPPEPVLPWSFVIKLIAAEPLKLDAGVNVRPFKAVLMSAAVPENTILLLCDPLPVVKVKPFVPFKDIEPFDADNVT